MSMHLEVLLYPLFYFSVWVDTYIRIASQLKIILAVSYYVRIAYRNLYFYLWVVIIAIASLEFLVHFSL